MKCYLRQLTYAVSIFLVVSLTFGEVIDDKRVKALAQEELLKSFAGKVRVKSIQVFIGKPIEYTSIERKSLKVREGEHRGSFHLYLKTKGGFRRITATLELEWKCTLLVAQEDIDRGERVYPWQVAYEERFLQRCPRQDVSSPEELINYVTLKKIKKGGQVKKSLLKKEPLIRRGQEVSLIYRSGNLEISFRGKALDTGFYGDTIRVRSLNTGKILRGRVISEEGVLLE
ncbi:flagella basal body P-ring formation protein FlgA [Hydrogenivirga caldilitoris]|uniref:Flagella basal body P-ring formation protein FlgA n=1 Tax=Hydrogenivirga caldilitoris TaxID=246264 RepID=A0A497XM58_9AQUI|nr:flagellar basal body P-ring formation chaperone FlgA [Hydrogenivirga caldilitoris]RLJ69986.1 flagella basal body P-ring formation protein FlgA [Hydrogenivirga caldilitoris]